MISRYIAFIILSVVVIIFTGCSSSRHVTSDEPMSKGHPQDDIISNGITLKAHRLPTIMLEENEKRVPHNVIKLNVGPSLVCSEVETPSRFYNSMLGLDYGIEYQHLWRSGFGVGASMYLFNSSFGKDLNMEINYMGPMVVYSDYLDSKGLVRADFEFGMGCGILKEKGFHDTNKETDFAAMVGLGVEYAVAKNVAFGLQLNWNTLYMFEPKGYYIKDEDLYGIERCSLLAGIRVYF